MRLENSNNIKTTSCKINFENNSLRIVCSGRRLRVGKFRWIQPEQKMVRGVYIRFNGKAKAKVSDGVRDVSKTTNKYLNMVAEWIVKSFINWTLPIPPAAQPTDDTVRKLINVKYWLQDWVAITNNKLANCLLLTVALSHFIIYPVSTCR